ncbi:MAG: tetratricopeptide repeat protein, partial [Deltaproteobacteria bacterium]|nr:tetratricopeptide repeat protein [Deltaproteobacteria bacterium]
VYNNLGIALASQGKLDQAIIIFKKALRINPNDIWVQRNLDQALREKARSGIVRPK